jgi:hypothetical protein
MFVAHRMIGAAAVFALAACSSTVSVYDATSSGGANLPGGALNLDGVWVGYIESYQFPSGSDAVRFTFATGADGAVTGTAVFGNKQTPPSPTNPNTGYPPGLNFTNFGSCGSPFAGEGFVYSVEGTTMEDGRLRFSVLTRELWKKWCELQKPYDAGPSASGYGCLPNWGFNGGESTCSQTDPSTDQDVPRDCGQLYLCAACEHTCNCNAEGCTVILAAASTDVFFDLKLVANTGDGSTTGRFGNHNVHLKKQ